MNINRLPPETLFNIFKYTSISDHINLAKTSKSIKEYADDNSQWDQFLKPSARPSLEERKRGVLSKNIFRDNLHARLFLFLQFDRKGKAYYQEIQEKLGKLNYLTVGLIRGSLKELREVDYIDAFKIILENKELYSKFSSISLCRTIQYSPPEDAETILGIIAKDEALYSKLNSEDLSGLARSLPKLKTVIEEVQKKLERIDPKVHKKIVPRH